MATTPNECWSRDFTADRLVDGRRFGVLMLVDNVSQGSLAIVADHSLTGECVVEVLDQFLAGGQRSWMPLVDNGPECIFTALDAWAHHHSVQLKFSRPGKPTDSALV